jgi:hypothetical protein
MKDVFDSLPEWPTVELRECEGPLKKFHPGETECVVRLNESHSISFFLNDLALNDLLVKIIERQRIRAIQNAVTVPTEM